MAQRTHTPLHTGDESPSCGLCSRRARLKLTAPTATLDTPSPISSTESTRRLPIIWPLVHILLRSSFLPDQRGKPTIHLLSSTSLLTPSAPYQTPKLFFLHQRSIIHKDWISRTGDPLPWPDQRQRSRSAPRHVQKGTVEGFSRIRRSESRRGEHPGRRASGRGRKPGEPGSSEPARGAVQSPAASQASAGKPSCLLGLPDLSGSAFFPCQGEELRFPEIQRGTARGFSPLLFVVSSPLFSR